MTTARDARAVAAATADADAERTALGWMTLLVEHGVLNGWADEDDEDDEGDEDDEDQAHATDGAGGAAAAAASASSGAYQPAVKVQADGNFDECAVCGTGGSLICCDACPQAYHAECLGVGAPPEDDDEDTAWYCPPCAQQLGMPARAGTSTSWHVT